MNPAAPSAAAIAAQIVANTAASFLANNTHNAALYKRSWKAYRVCPICAHVVGNSGNNFRMHVKKCAPLIYDEIETIQPAYFGTFEQCVEASIMKAGADVEAVGGTAVARDPVVSTSPVPFTQPSPMSMTPTIAPPSPSLLALTTPIGAGSIPMTQAATVGTPTPIPAPPAAAPVLAPSGFTNPAVGLPLTRSASTSSINSSASTATPTKSRNSHKGPFPMIICPKCSKRIPIHGGNLRQHLQVCQPSVYKSLYGDTGGIKITNKEALQRLNLTPIEMTDREIEEIERRRAERDARRMRQVESMLLQKSAVSSTPSANTRAASAAAMAASNISLQQRSQLPYPVSAQSVISAGAPHHPVFSPNDFLEKTPDYELWEISPVLESLERYCTNAGLLKELFSSDPRSMPTGQQLDDQQEEVHTWMRVLEEASNDISETELKLRLTCEALHKAQQGPFSTVPSSRSMEAMDEDAWMTDAPTEPHDDWESRNLISQLRQRQQQLRAEAINLSSDVRILRHGSTNTDQSGSSDNTTSAVSTTKHLLVL